MRAQELGPLPDGIPAPDPRGGAGVVGTPTLRSLHAQTPLPQALWSCPGRPFSPEARGSGWRVHDPPPWSHPFLPQPMQETRGWLCKRDMDYADGGEVEDSDRDRETDRDESGARQDDQHAVWAGGDKAILGAGSRAERPPGRGEARRGCLGACGPAGGINRREVRGLGLDLGLEGLTAGWEGDQWRQFCQRCAPFLDGAIPRSYLPPEVPPPTLAQPFLPACGAARLIRLQT